MDSRFIPSLEAMNSADDTNRRVPAPIVVQRTLQVKYLVTNSNQCSDV
ncbi:MAG: hypothetical protein WCP07_08515 [bacterium]